MLTLKRMDMDSFEEIKELFRSVFAAPPWNEDWSDEEQLDNYLKDLMEVRLPIILGLYDDDRFIGVSIGCVRHWYGGTEYFIEELCIRSDLQRRGYGTKFIFMIEDYIKEHGMMQIFLMTDRTQPAYKFYKKLGFDELPEHASFFREL